MSNRAPADATGDVRGGTLGIYTAGMLMYPTGFATAVIAARVLGPTPFGQLVLVATLVGWVEVFCIGPLGKATVRAVAETGLPRVVAGQAVRLHLAAGLVGMMVVVALHVPVAALLGDASLAEHLLLLSPMPVLNGLASGMKSTLVGMRRYGASAWIEAARWTSRLAMVAALAFFGLTVKMALGAYLAASALQLALSWYTVRPPLRSSADAKGLGAWSAAAGLVPSTLLMRIVRLDIAVVQAFRGAAQAGQYGIATTASQPLTLLLTVLSQTMLPKLTRQCQDGERARARESARQALRVVWLLLPAVAVLSASAEQLVVPVFGERFRDAVPMLRWLAFAGWCRATLTLANSILAGFGHARWTLASTIPVACLAVAGFALVVPQHGGVGAAVVLTVVGAGGVVIALGLAFVRCGVASSWLTLLRCGAVAAVGSLVVSFWTLSGLMGLLPPLAVGLGCALLLFLLGEISSDDVNGWRDWARRRASRARA